MTVPVHQHTDTLAEFPTKPSTSSTHGALLSLAQIQDLFQRAVMDGDAEILSSIPGNGRTTADVLLGVYQHAYRARLSEILAGDYPLLAKHLGQESFGDLAEAYISAHPSDTPNVRWFSRHLPAFLKSHDMYSTSPHFGELAAVEHALANAFDAEDHHLLTKDDLHTVSPDAWADLTFFAQPAVARLTNTHNTFDLWHALQSDSEAPDIQHLDEAQHLIVWRKDDSARIRPMSGEEAMMWDEARRGVPFGRLCELVATYDNPETAALRAAQYLQGWIDSELLARD